MNYKELSEELNYDPATGRFTWKKEAGTISNGYRLLRVNQKNMWAHRVAWLMATGEDPEGMVIDHINGDRLDNRIENLRTATYSQNSANAKRHSRNTSGLKGASKRFKNGKWTGRWQASITYQRKQINLGYFDTKEEAHAAYLEAARRLQGEFANCGNVKELVPRMVDPSLIVPLGFGA
jgi:hypothetical protein